MLDSTHTSEFDQTVETAKLLQSARVLFGASATGQELLRNLQVIATTDMSIVLQGEAGTGKELVARWLHDVSPYGAGRFITATSWTMENYGSSYGDPDESRTWSIVNQLQDARLATLFVENVEGLEARTQASLARLLQDSPFIASTGPNAPASGIRIISATQSDLRQEALSGNLRPDFFHCISAYTARLMPLRSRLDELPALVHHFIQVHSRDLGLSPRALSRDALQVLQQYHWPGNLRELEEILIGYVLTNSEVLLLEKISALQRSTEGAAREPLDKSRADESLSSASASAIQQLDDNTILKALRENGWNRRRTASRLQISYRSLLYKLKKMDLASGHRPRTA